MLFGNELLAIAAVLGLVLFTLFLLAKRSSQRSRLMQMMGLEGTIIFADQGRRGRYFITKTYGIIAKPDFIVKLKTGEIAVVEYKNRKNNRLYESDKAQVKATTLAVRSKMRVDKAYVLAGKKLHQVLIPKDDAKLFEQIAGLVEYAKRAKSGELIKIYTEQVYFCKSCSVRSICLRKRSGSINQARLLQ